MFRSEKFRTVLHLSQKVVTDSQFPFKAGDNLVVRIDPENQQLIIRKDSRPVEKKPEKKARAGKA